jgi:hypothetical protein
MDDRGSDSARSRSCCPLKVTPIRVCSFERLQSGVMYLQTESSETTKLIVIVQALKQGGWILSKLYRSHVIGHGVLNGHVQPGQCQMGERL